MTTTPDPLTNEPVHRIQGALPLTPARWAQVREDEDRMLDMLNADEDWLSQPDPRDA